MFREKCSRIQGEPRYVGERRGSRQWCLCARRMVLVTQQLSCRYNRISDLLSISLQENVFVLEKELLVSTS